MLYILLIAIIAIITTARKAATKRAAAAARLERVRTELAKRHAGHQATMRELEARLARVRRTLAYTSTLQYQRDLKTAARAVMSTYDQHVETHDAWVSLLFSPFVAPGEAAREAWHEMVNAASEERQQTYNQWHAAAVEHLDLEVLGVNKKNELELIEVRLDEERLEIEALEAAQRRFAA